MITNILEIGALACVVFTGFILFMAFSGIASAMRDEEGKFRKEKSIKSVLGIGMFLCFLLGLLLFANIRYTNSLPTTPGLIDLWINSFGVFFVLHVYDLLVLDFLIVVTWHPTFLNLPNTPYYRTFRPHLIGFFKGIPLGMIASLLASLLFLWYK
jgi:vacuolar-type H+-ATPase subunit I/STV1